MIMIMIIVMIIIVIIIVNVIIVALLISLVHSSYLPSTLCLHLPPPSNSVESPPDEVLHAAAKHILPSPC